MTTTLKVDIAIVGAGLVGLAASIALEQMGYAVAIIDAKDPNQKCTKIANDSLDKRIYAVSPTNAAWLKDLGVWSLLAPERIGEMQAMEIWGDDTAQPLTLSAEDANADFLGFIVENSLLSQAMLSLINASSIKTLFGKNCSSLIVGSRKSPTTVHLSTGESVECKVLLAADGANSWVRQQLNIATQQKSYQQVGVVANFDCEKTHANIARQWFAKDTDNHNKILAWLPLAENKISIVWSVNQDYGQHLLQLSAEAFTQEVTVAGLHQLGKMELITPPDAFPLTMRKADDLVHAGIVFIGDAAHQIHPMAGQGMNLGFRDVIDFVEIIKMKSPFQSIGDYHLLRMYERKRKDDVAKMLLLTDGLFRLFNSPTNALKSVRNQGLLAINHSPIKKLLVKSAVSH